MRLILDKIRIPLDLAPTARPRLLSELRLSLSSCTSTIINGRAGTGKTLLSADFALNCDRHVAWYKVDAPESDRRMFFRYLLESVRTQRREFQVDPTMRLVETIDEENSAMLAEFFIYGLQESGKEPLLIVIDDLHLVYDTAWAVPFFRRLLPLVPAEVHVLITGRTLPPAPLWRMRSKQTLSVIDESMLAFSIEEAKELFASYGLTETQAFASLRQTRGRAFPLDTVAQLLAATEILSHSRDLKRSGPRLVQHRPGLVC